MLPEMFFICINNLPMFPEEDLFASDSALSILLEEDDEVSKSTALNNSCWAGERNHSERVLILAACLSCTCIYITFIV